MTAFVLDTNVLIVSNNRDNLTVGPACVRKSVDCLEEARRALVVIDADHAVLREYNHKVNSKGQPGPGDAFLKWLYQNMWKAERCEQVHLTPHDVRVFEEFPVDLDLADFDRSDRKFVAIALKSEHDPVIAISADSDWDEKRHQRALRRNGVKLHFVCRP